MNYQSDKQPKRVCAYIDLSAIEENLNQIKNKLLPGTKIIAIIKADGYGHGAVPIAKRVEEREDIWGFGVATAEEAIDLREQQIKKPILILGYTFQEHYDVLCEQDISLTCFSLEMANELSKTALQWGKEIKIHLKLDTGMGRVGFPMTPDAIAECGRIAGLPGVSMEGIFTHFAKADEEDLSYTHMQWSKFQSFIDNWNKEGFSLPLLHCCNSAGIMNLQEANLDLVRPGIILYGIYPSQEVKKEGLPLTCALELKSHLVHVKEIDKGEAVSYGGTFVATGKMKIGTIPVGYGDGYPRSLSNKGYVLIHGKKAPIVGRICMDQFMVDVSDIPNVKVRDEVTLIGRDGEKQISVEELGDLSGRFPYEFVCDLGKRIPRIYV